MDTDNNENSSSRRNHSRRSHGHRPGDSSSHRHGSNERSRSSSERSQRRDGRESSESRMVRYKDGERRSKDSGPQRSRYYDKSQRHGGYSEGHEHINNNLVWAIIVTLLCCVPTGLVAIYYSSKVDSLSIMGQRQLAREYARKSQIWCWVSFIGCIISIFLGFVLGIVGSI